MRTLGVLLAAGASRRFGVADKLLAPWGNETLVAATARLLLGAGCDSCSAVVSSEAVEQALPPGLTPWRVTPGLEMSASFQAACRLAEQAGAGRLLILLADMPLVAPATIVRLLQSPDDAACHHAGRRLPPVLLHRATWQGQSWPEGDFGARALIRSLPEQALIALTGAEARDVDTIADLAAASQLR